MLYYIPLEHVESRYTKNLDTQIQDHLIESGIDFVKIYPILNPEKRTIKNGSFLDAPTTIEFKSKQIAAIAKQFYEDNVNDGDEFFFSDIWFPGVESLAYLRYFCKKKIKLKGILHAGSFTDTDFVRDMERWAKNFEDILFDIFDEIYVASDFIKQDVLKKRFCDDRKIKVTPFPLDEDTFIIKDIKFPMVVFNGRNVDEKQPHLFDELEKKVDSNGIEAVFINTQKENLSKKEYHKILKLSKVVVSFALQENFGFGINEAVVAGCVPVLPNRLVYPEFYPKEFLYNSFDECVDLVIKALKGSLTVNTKSFQEKALQDRNLTLKTWFS